MNDKKKIVDRPCPHVGSGGVPWCSMLCSRAKYDCFEYGAICEPAVRGMAREIKRLRRKIADVAPAAKEEQHVIR